MVSFPLSREALGNIWGTFGEDELQGFLDQQEDAPAAAVSPKVDSAAEMETIEVFDGVVQPSFRVNTRRLRQRVIDVDGPAFFLERRQHGFLIRGGSVKLLDEQTAPP